MPKSYPLAVSKTISFDVGDSRMERSQYSVEGQPNGCVSRHNPSSIWYGTLPNDAVRYCDMAHLAINKSDTLF